jgi:glyoxylate reductase
MMTGLSPHGKENYLKPPVFLSRRVPDAVLEELAALFDLVVHDSDRAPTRAALLAGVDGRAGIVTMLTDRVDEELLDAAGPSLRVVANHAAGFDNVDLPAATARSVLVANTPDVLTEATAELTIALMLDVVRRVSEGDRLVRSGAAWEWAPTFMLGGMLRGRTLGIVGLGRIGSEVARLAAAFGMQIVSSGGHGVGGGRKAAGHSRELQRATGIRRVGLAELLARSHVVSLHCPLTAETHHLIGPTEFRSMRPDAVLVNTARGPIVDEAALADALAAGEIAGAGLDVYEREPDVTDSLRALPSVVLAPHLGSATQEAREAMGMLCVEALRAVLLEGRVPANALNPDVL